MTVIDTSRSILFIGPVPRAWESAPMHAAAMAHDGVGVGQLGS